MKLNAFSILLILTSLSSWPSSFAGEKDCSQLLQPFLSDLFHEAPESLSFSPSSVRIVGEKLSAGEIILSHQKLPPLENGAYLYLIDQKGTLIFSNRVPDLNDFAEPLASHRSLYYRLNSFNQNVTDVVAAGEFEIHHHRVSLINNKSGTFRGNEKNLRWAEDVLLKRGLEIEKNTVRTDYSPGNVFSGKHLKELDGAHALVRVMADPQKKKLYEKILKQVEKIYAYYPSKVPGKMHLDSFLSSRELKFGNPRNPSLVIEHLEWNWAQQLLSHAQIDTDFAAKLEEMIAVIGYKKTNSVFDHIFNLEGTFGK